MCPDNGIGFIVEYRGKAPPFDRVQRVLRWLEKGSITYEQALGLLQFPDCSVTAIRNGDVEVQEARLAQADLPQSIYRGSVPK